MSQESIQQKQSSGFQSAEMEGAETGSQSFSPPQLKLAASSAAGFNGNTIHRSPGDRYERGNRPDPSPANGGIDIISNNERVINVGDWATFSLRGTSVSSGITWQILNNGGTPTTARSTSNTIRLRGDIVGTHIIRATVPTDGGNVTVDFTQVVERDAGYTDIDGVTPTPLNTMNDFIDLVVRVENALPGYAWQDVASKIRKERYPSPGGRYGGIKAALTWDDLIDEQDHLSPLQSSQVAVEDIAALRRTGSVTHNGVNIDIGHVMTGIDSMNFPTTNGIFENHNMSGPAAATWSGDVGSALVNWANNAPGNDHTDAKKQEFYDRYMSMTDLMGDLDGINLGGMAVAPSAPLSTRLRAYYVTNQSTQANRRYHNFCQVSGFGISGGRLDSAARTYIRQQVLNFANGYNIGGRILDGMSQAATASPYGGMPIYNPNREQYTSQGRVSGNVDWFVNYFINQIETGLAAE